MADANHFQEAADGLKSAAAALQACADAYGKTDSDTVDATAPTPVAEQPKNMRDATVRVREHFRKQRGQAAR